MNFKRKKCRRQVRCTMCTVDRWKGNSVDRFKPCEHQEKNLDLDDGLVDEQKGRRLKKPKRPKPFVLEYRRKKDSPGWAWRGSENWIKFARYHSMVALEQAKAKYLSDQSHYARYYEFRIRPEQERLAS